MKNEENSRTDKAEQEPDDVAPEYDFATMPGGVRGKYHKAMREGYTVAIEHSDGTIERRQYLGEDAVQIDPDVRPYFPDAESVNNALRGLIALIPKKRRASSRRAANK